MNSEIEAVKKQLDAVREDFIDYICSGVPNPAPYCGNRTPQCCDKRGWCRNNEICNGFTPRAGETE